MRITSELWVAALIRRATTSGAFATVLTKGSPEAGSIYVVVSGLAGPLSLLAPAPQFLYDDQRADERLFEQILTDVSESEISTKLAAERRFDPDIWVVEIEDREGRSFVETIVKAQE